MTVILSSTGIETTGMPPTLIGAMAVGSMGGLMARVSGAGIMEIGYHTAIDMSTAKHISTENKALGFGT
jgi:hypothetical protein